jgi:nitrogen fixation protein FixH
MKRQRISWGTGVVVAVVVFLSGMLGLAVIAAREEVSLVHTRYFDRGQQYGGRLRAMERAQALRDPLTVHVEHGIATVAYPHRTAVREITGTVTLYRPSNGSLDRTLAVAPDSSWTQSFHVGGLEPGLWKIQVEWKMGGEEYYIEQPMMLQQ